MSYFWNQLCSDPVPTDVKKSPVDSLTHLIWDRFHYLIHQIRSDSCQVTKRIRGGSWLFRGPFSEFSCFYNGSSLPHCPFLAPVPANTSSWQAVILESEWVCYQTCSSVPMKAKRWKTRFCIILQSRIHPQYESMSIGHSLVYDLQWFAPEWYSWYSFWVLIIAMSYLRKLFWFVLLNLIG